jgi:xanthine/uracil/vitamin C permease (AzgA family)
LVVNLAFSDFLMMVIMSPPMVINCYFATWVLGKCPKCYKVKWQYALICIVTAI